MQHIPKTAKITSLDQPLAPELADLVATLVATQMAAECPLEFDLPPSSDTHAFE